MENALNAKYLWQLRCVSLWAWPASHRRCNLCYFWVCRRSGTTSHWCWCSREEFTLTVLACQQSLLTAVQMAVWKPPRSAGSNGGVPVLPFGSRSFSCSLGRGPAQTSKAAWPSTSREGWSSACGTGSPKPTSRTGEIPPVCAVALESSGSWALVVPMRRI